MKLKSHHKDKRHGLKVIDYAISLAKEAVRLLPEWDELKMQTAMP